MPKFHVKRCLVCLVLGVAIGCYGTVQTNRVIQANPVLRAIL